MKPSIVVVAFTHGRWDLLARTIDSFDRCVTGNVVARVLMVDGVHPRSCVGDVDQALGAHQWAIEWSDRQRGFGGNIDRAWRQLTARFTAADCVFHLEDDFTFNRQVNLDELAAVLYAQPQLAQLALRRQPISQGEREAGGVVEQWPAEYAERSIRMMSACGWGADAICRTTATWLEHRLFFTTNPSLYRRALCQVGWPTCEASERELTHQLLVEGLPWGVEPGAVRFGYWGARHSGEWVHHIGTDDRRDGTGY